jgi:predicted component of type VI protein secretion system
MINLRKALFGVSCTTATVIILSLLIMIGSLSGCGKSTAVKREEVVFNITPDAHVNDDRPVYIVIRKVNKMEFLTDNYDGITDVVCTNPPPESLMAWQMLLPGQNEKIQVFKPEKSDIGIYVLFANPGENWKIILEAPLKKEYNIKVKPNELEEFQRGFFK